MDAPLEARLPVRYEGAERRRVRTAYPGTERRRPEPATEQDHPELCEPKAARLQ